MITKNIVAIGNENQILNYSDYVKQTEKKTLNKKADSKKKNNVINKTRKTMIVAQHK